MTTIDLSSGWTEVDASSRISRTATTETFTALTNQENTYAYGDYGVGYFTDTFYAEGEFNITAATSATSKGLDWGFADSIGGTGSTTNQAGFLFVLNSANTQIESLYSRLRESSVDHSAVVGGLTLAINTLRKYRVGVFTSLGGQYGGVLAQIFDSTGTTLLASVVAVRGATTSYRYFYSIQAATGGAAGTITGTHSNITLFASAAGINLTTFTKVDPNSHLALYANCITCTTLSNNENANVYKNYGAGYFSGNYTVNGALNVTSFVNGGGGMGYILLLEDAAPANSASALITWISTTTYSLKAREYAGATEYLSGASSTLSTNTPYWIQLNRDTAVGTYGTLYLKIFSDPAYTVQVGATLSLTLHSGGSPTVAAYSRLYAAVSYNNGQARSSTFTIGGVTIGPSTTTGAIALTTDDSVVAVTASIHNAAQIAFTTDPADVHITATKNSPVANIAFITDASDVAITSAFKFPGTIAFTTDASDVYVSAHGPTYLSAYLITDSAVVSALASVIAVVEAFDAKIRHKTTGAAITGLTTVYLTVNQPATGYRWDFSNNTFTATPTTPTLVLAEVSAANQPGLYRSLVTTTSWAGWVEFEATYNDGSYTYSYSGEAYYTNGTRANGTWLPSEWISINDLVADADYLINNMPTASVNAAAVRTNLTTELASVLAMEKVARNQYVLNPTNGVITVYANDGITPLYTALAYKDAARTALYDGNGAVHATTRLA